MWLRRLAAVFRHRAIAAELLQEMDFHREMRQRAIETDGVSAAEAALAARRAMGNTAMALEDARAVWVWRWLESVWQDASYAVRTIRRQAGSTALALVVLAITIGLNTSLFTVFSGLVLRPWPGVADASHIVGLYLNDPVMAAPGGFSSSHADFLREHAKSLSGLVAMRADAVSLGDGARLGDGRALIVGGGFFDVLGIRMARGRGFRADEDRPQEPQAVVVLGDRLWRSRFGADPSIVGGSIRINERPFTVVGIASAEFASSEPGAMADLFLPMAAAPLIRHSDPAAAAGGDWFLGDLAARLAPGVTREQARAELNLLTGQFDGRADRTPRNVLVTGTAFVDHPGRGQILVAASLVSAGLTLVWLVACANVGNLMLARAAARSREIGIRLAIGASRFRIVRQLLTEGFVVSVAACAIGVVIAVELPQWLLQIISGDRSASFPFSVRPDVFALGYAVLMAAISSIAFGLAPALHATGPDVAHPWTERDGLPNSHVPMRSLLLGVQVAVSVVLLTIATLLVRGSREQTPPFEPDFSIDGLTVTSFEVPAGAYDEQRSRALIDDLEAALDRLPIEAFAFTSQEPFSQFRSGTAFRRQGETERDRKFVSTLDVEPAYLDLLHIPIVAGRNFEPNDRDRPVALVNEAFARQYWPNEDPIGKTVILRQSEMVEVIGVVRNAHMNWTADVEPLMFQPLKGAGRLFPRLLLRAAGPGALEALGRLVERLDPRIKLQTSVLSSAIERRFSSGPARYGRLLAQVLGGFALALATVGMFGVFAYAVRQRTREIGVRMALGAPPSSVIRLVLGGHSRTVLVGALVGLLGAVAVSTVLRSNLRGISPFDPVSYVAVALLVASAGLVASYIPARRATRIHPMEALRCD